MAMSVQQQAAPVAKFEAADRHLRKEMGFVPILFMSIGAIIGSGWLLASLAAAATAGPAAVISWVIGGIFIIFIALSYAELSGMLPRTGAIVRYPVLTHGAFTGWVIGWTYFLSAITVPAIEAEAVVTYIGSSQVAPHSGLTTTDHGITVLAAPRGILFFLGLMALFFVLNYFGIKLLSRVNHVVTWWKLVIPTVTFCFLLTIFHGSNFTAYHGFAPFGTSAIFQALSTTGIIFAYLGFRQALDYAGEAKKPQRDVPLATILSVVITMAIYTLLQLAFTGALRWGSAGTTPGDWAGLTSGTWANAPLYSALTAAGIGALSTYAWFLLVDAGISPSGTGWIYMGTSTRTNYGLSVHGFAPKPLQWHNRFGIPWVALIVALIVGCIFVIPYASWYTLVGFITATTVLTYIMGGLGLPVMRKYAANLHRPFRLRMAWFWAPIGYLAAMMVVYWSGFKELSSVYGAVFIGLTLFAWYYAPIKGWMSKWMAGTLGVVFLGLWIWESVMGGWVMRIAPPATGSWSFWVYDVALSATVIGFCLALWLFGNAECKKHVARTSWLIIMLLAVLPVSYYGNFGGYPSGKAPLVWPWGTLVVVGIGIVTYYWGVASGFNTQELQEITAAAPTQVSAPPEPVPGPDGRQSRHHAHMPRWWRPHHAVG
jgi:amino acid transporter